MRYDVLILNSGTGVAALRARLELVAPSAHPITLVRRQDIGTVTWHRLSYDRLRDALDGADEDRVLSELASLDAANEVPVVNAEQLDAGEEPYGVVMLGTEVIGYGEERLHVPSRGPTRSGSADRNSALREPSPPPEGYAWAPASPAGVPVGGDDGSGAAEAREGLDTDSRFGAFPSIDAPKTVEPGETFEVAIGVSGTDLRHTVSAGIDMTDLDPYARTIRLQVSLVSPYLDFVGDPDEFAELKVNRATLEHNPVIFTLEPGEPPPTYDPVVGVWTSRMTAMFFYEDTIVGEGYREIRVNQSRARPAANESDRAPVAEASVVTPIGEGTDLTITIEQEDPSGNYTVRTFSPHLSKLAQGRIELGQDQNHFAAELVEQIETALADEVSDETVGYVGKLVAAKMPDPVKRAIRDVWNALAGPEVDENERRVPDVLILTDDWAVPWELMMIELDESKPSFLGAQVNIGRWPYQYRDLLDFGPVGVNALGVMVGHYPESAERHPRLKEAEQEGRELEERYHARMVDADTRTLDQLLRGRFVDGFEFEALHFAAHGRRHRDGGAYMVYSDGRPMSTWALGRASMAADKRAFLFLNACQVGTAERMLSTYSGVAGTAISGGFTGFVAPLWSIADDVAKDISLGLYEASAKGKTISAFLREVRERFVQTPDDVAHTTNMAYVFYGHPGLRLGGPALRQP